MSTDETIRYRVQGYVGERRALEEARPCTYATQAEAQEEATSLADPGKPCCGPRAVYEVEPRRCVRRPGFGGDRYVDVTEDGGAA